MLRNLIHPFLLWHNYNTKENLKWAAIEVLSRTCAKFNLRKSWSHYWKKHTMKKCVEHSLELTVCKRATFCLIKGGYLSFTFWSLSQYVWVILSQKPEFLLQVTINFCIVIDFGYRSLDFILSTVFISKNWYLRRHKFSTLFCKFGENDNKFQMMHFNHTVILFKLANWHKVDIFVRLNNCLWLKHEWLIHI